MMRSCSSRAPGARSGSRPATVAYQSRAFPENVAWTDRGRRLRHSARRRLQRRSRRLVRRSQGRRRQPATRDASRGRAALARVHRARGRGARSGWTRSSTPPSAPAPRASSSACRPTCGTRPRRPPSCTPSRRSRPCSPSAPRRSEAGAAPAGRLASAQDRPPGRPAGQPHADRRPGLHQRAARVDQADGRPVAPRVFSCQTVEFDTKTSPHRRGLTSSAAPGRPGSQRCLRNGPWIA